MYSFFLSGPILVFGLAQLECNFGLLFWLLRFIRFGWSRLLSCYIQLRSIQMLVCFFPNEVQLCSKFLTLPFSNITCIMAAVPWSQLAEVPPWHLSGVALERQDLSKDATHEEENQTAAILFLTSSSLEFLGGFVGIEIRKIIWWSRWRWY